VVVVVVGAAVVVVGAAVVVVVGAAVVVVVGAAVVVVVVGAAVVVVVGAAADVVKLTAENPLETSVVALKTFITNKYCVEGNKGAVVTGAVETEEVSTLDVPIMGVL